MMLNKGELVAWDAVAAVLEEENDPEAELLVDIIQSRATNRKPIGSQPGAFDATLIPLVSAPLYATAVAVIAAVLPKLFDAGLDIAKDVLKKRLDPAKREPTTAPNVDPLSDLSQLRQRTLAVAKANGLSASRAQKLADALVLAVLSEKSNEAALKT